MLLVSLRGATFLSISQKGLPRYFQNLRLKILHFVFSKDKWHSEAVEGDAGSVAVAFLMLSRRPLSVSPR